jgi:hypothetical protein
MIEEGGGAATSPAQEAYWSSKYLSMVLAFLVGGMDRLTLDLGVSPGVTGEDKSRLVIFRFEPEAVSKTRQKKFPAFVC